ncbi:nucleoside hydrolase [Saccharolobus shibatae]|uniref:Inosine-uridine preferring nucleoside hydrolase n=1 Tax=Saccharolobus shibatae TaxID=2286 RepID=A0A8F5BU56_9CREN|nr:nucleoside hydrolase [Saccharolobus shibatae]QXJ31512.1 Inosine-uridine preferring nucleoside hydrolase [Saccharolobus shibatae]QXJ34528.1 Inosine-uridine preferring nucleoside hydrolase [Saccharolobus shibatae]
MRKVILDSDTASDDTIAILLASRYFQLLGVTIVAGNVNYNQEVKNALFTLEYIGKQDVPVYLGSQRPILGNWRTVEEVHGSNGMGDWDYPEPTKRPEKEHAIDAILRLSKEYDGELEILAVSPLTNIALAYLKDPSVVKRIRRIWIMGGAFSKGNTTPIAEFNFWVDPEAAKIVLDAGFDITVVPWEVAETSGSLNERDWEFISKLNTKLSKFFINVNKTLKEYTTKNQGISGSTHPDSLTVSIAYDRSIISESSLNYIDVELCSKSRGAMLIDWYSLHKNKPNAEIVLKADSNKFKNLLFRTLSQF